MHAGWKARWHTKLIISFFTCTAAIFFLTRFGQNSQLPDKYELVWHMRPCALTPIYTGARTERSHFMNMIALHDAAGNLRVTKLNIIMNTGEELSLAAADEIVNIIMRFKKNGKQVCVWANEIERMSQFMVFAAADKRYFIKNDRVIELSGMSAIRQFEGNKYTKEKVEVIGFQVGDYKGGVAPALSTGFDYYSSANTRAMFNDMMQHIRCTLAFLLNKDAMFVEHMLQKKYFTAQEIIEMKLADGVQAFEASSQHINLDEYIARVSNSMNGSKNIVPIVTIDFVLQGPVSEYYARMLNNIANDESIKVVVLVLHCLGSIGNGVELIEQALLQLKAKGKYLVVLVDRVATSGGYILASCGDKIITRPCAIVGSIGAYCVGFDDTLAQKEKGVEKDAIYTHSRPDILSDYEKQKTQELIAKHVQLWKVEVAKRRKLPSNLVDDLANGQIYSGMAGYAIGLVDSLDGYIGMLELVSALLNHEGFRFVFLPDEYMIRDWIMGK